MGVRFAMRGQSANEKSRNLVFGNIEFAAGRRALADGESKVLDMYAERNHALLQHREVQRRAEAPPQAVALALEQSRHCLGHGLGRAYERIPRHYRGCEHVADSVHGEV
jgi:hypothetical protein